MSETNNDQEIKTQLSSLNREMTRLGAEVGQMKQSTDLMSSLFQYSVEPLVRKCVQKQYGSLCEKRHRIESLYDVTDYFAKTDCELPGIEGYKELKGDNYNEAEEEYTVRLAAAIVKQGLVYDWWEALVATLKEKGIEVEGLNVARAQVDYQSLDVRNVAQEFTVPEEKLNLLRGRVTDKLPQQETESIHRCIDLLKPGYSLLGKKGPGVLLITFKASGKPLCCKTLVELTVRGKCMLFPPSDSPWSSIWIGDIVLDPSRVPESKERMNENLEFLKWSLSAISPVPINSWSLDPRVFLPRIKQTEDLNDDQVILYYPDDPCDDI